MYSAHGQLMLCTDAIHRIHMLLALSVAVAVVGALLPLAKSKANAYESI